MRSATLETYREGGVAGVVHVCRFLQVQQNDSCIKMFGAMHFIYYINRSIATIVNSTYLGY